MVAQTNMTCYQNISKKKVSATIPIKALVDTIAQHSLS